MSLFSELIRSNKKFYNRLSNSSKNKADILLFDVFFLEKSLIYGIAKTALFIANIQGLKPLGLVPQNSPKINRQFIKSMCFETTGTRFSLFRTLLKNIAEITLLVVKVRDKQTLLELAYLDVKVGPYIYDGLLRSLSLITVEKITFRIRMRLVVELVYFFHFYSLIGKNRVKFVVCSDNVYRYGLLFELAKINSIPCISPINLNGYSMSYYRDNADYEVHNRKPYGPAIANIDLIEAKKVLNEYFKERYRANIVQHDVAFAYSDDKLILSRNELDLQYKLNPGLPIVIVMAHIFSDAPHAYPNTLYDDYYEWFVNSVKSLMKNKHINVLVKEHPSVSLYNEEGVVREILTELGCEYILLKNNVHNLTVLNEVDVVLTCGGTIGQEFSYVRKPVVLAAKPPYSGYGFTAEPNDIVSYELLLRNGIQNLAKLNDSQFDKAVKVLYYDFIELNNYKEFLEIGGQQYTLGGEFDDEKFFARIIEENKTDFEDQHIYRMLFGFLNGDSKHIVSPPKVELSNV